MTVEVKFFASCREAVGLSSLSISFAEGQEHSTRVLLAILTEKFPQLEEMLPYSGVAVNMNYVVEDTPLKDGDSVAILPPISGG